MERLHLISTLILEYFSVDYSPMGSILCVTPIFLFAPLYHK